MPVLSVSFMSFLLSKSPGVFMLETNFAFCGANLERWRGKI